MASRTMFPSICLAPYFNRSQAQTYAIATTKNTIAHATKVISRIDLTPHFNGSRAIHAGTHQKKSWILTN
jgi:hypothetical protein